MATWPTSLPQTMLIEGNSETSQPGSVRTDMDAGPAFVRQRFSAVSRFFTGGLVLTKTQVATLDTFFHTTLIEGSDTFTWTHPRTGASATVRFTAPPAYQHLNAVDLYQASISIEIPPS